MAESRAHGCRRAAAIGCAGIALLFAVAIVIAGLNLDRIRNSELGQTVAQTWSEGRASFEGLSALQTEILSTFPMDSCEFNLEWVYGQGTTLQIILEEPDLGGEEDAEAWARDVALWTVERSDAVGSFDNLEIQIRQVRGFLPHRDSYSFPVAELRSSLLPEEEGDDAVAGDELLLPER